MHSLRYQLALACVLPIGVLALGAGYLLATTSRVERALGAVIHHAQASRQALVLAAAAREQYNHVAHVLLLPREVEHHHLHHFEVAVSTFDRANTELIKLVAGDPSASELREEVEQLAKRFQGVFREGILPAHNAGKRELALGHHIDAERVLAEFVTACDALSAHFEATARGIQARAASAASQATAVTFGSFALVLIVAVVVNFWLWRSMHRPLRRISTAIEAMGEGELTTQIQVDQPQELAAIASCLNAMATRLRERESELLQAERKATLGQLTAGIAHQLNNPLAVMLGYVKVLADPSYAEPQRREALEVLEQEIGHCLETVQSLMTLVRPSPVERQEFDLSDLLERVVSSARRYRPASEVEVRLDVSSELTVTTDERKFEQALLNLVSNAYEAMEDRGVLSIEARECGEQIEVLVSDTGPGVLPAERHQVFEAFYSTKRAGTGLGLAFARNLIEAVGGELRLTSSPGEGATFCVRLPITLADNEPVELARTGDSP